MTAAYTEKLCDAGRQRDSNDTSRVTCDGHVAAHGERERKKRKGKREMVKTCASCHGYRGPIPTRLRPPVPKDAARLPIAFARQHRRVAGPTHARLDSRPFVARVYHGTRQAAGATNSELCGKSHYPWARGTVNAVTHGPRFRCECTPLNASKGKSSLTIRCVRCTSSRSGISRGETFLGEKRLSRLSIVS